LLGSIVLYILSRWFDWNIASYPPGTTWYFNSVLLAAPVSCFAAWVAVLGEIAKYSKWVLVEKLALTIAAALDPVRVCHCHDLAQRIPRIADPEMDDQGDLIPSTRPISTCCASPHFPGARHLRYASYPTQVEAT